VRASSVLWCRSVHLSCVALLCACGAAPQGSRTGSAPSVASAASSNASELERFLPLKADTVFSYRAWLPESSAPELLILQVERSGPTRASLRSGSSIKRIELMPDGIRLVTGGYLLKPPLREGADWAGPAGRVRISGLDVTVDVAAGHFAGCLETTESDARGGSPRTITTTYCPDVGIVKFSVADGEREERFELQSFGPRVDIDRL
jgi:hypothetical protein